MLVADPATGVEFPETLIVPSRVRLPPFKLVGVGVRTVSFLRMKVYSVAFYADLSNPSLKVRMELMSLGIRYSLCAQIPENVSPEEKIQYIVSNTACLIRIGEPLLTSARKNKEIVLIFRLVPVRNTSFSHLRDGFMRTLQAHMSAQLKEGQLTADVAELVQAPRRKFKSMFPSTSFAKGQPLDIILLQPPKTPADQRTLVVRDLGSVENNWVAE